MRLGSTLAAFAVALIFSTQNATAGIVTFDLRQGPTGTLSPVENVSAGGVDLEISGWGGTGNGNAPFDYNSLTPLNLWRSSTSGMGVSSGN